MIFKLLCSLGLHFVRCQVTQVEGVDAVKRFNRTVSEFRLAVGVRSAEVGHPLIDRLLRGVVATAVALGANLELCKVSTHVLARTEAVRGGAVTGARPLAGDATRCTLPAGAHVVFVGLGT